MGGIKKRMSLRGGKIYYLLSRMALVTIMLLFMMQSVLTYFNWWVNLGLMIVFILSLVYIMHVLDQEEVCQKESRLLAIGLCLLMTVALIVSFVV